MPPHSHAVGASSTAVNKSPGDSVPAYTAAAASYGSATDLTMNPNMIKPNSGGEQPHNNMPPYLVTNWCIALEGIFPSRQ